MEIIRNYLEKNGYSTVKQNHYNLVDEWADWYSCSIDDFHKTTFFNGKCNVKKQMKMLGMAKTVCEDWANLLMNEKVQITVGTDEQNDRLYDVLRNNKFYKNANRLVEKYMALGTGAFVEYISDGKVKIDYVRAEMIYPLTWNNEGIQECAFGSKIVYNNQECIFLQMHLLENGKYVIENHLFIEAKNEVKEIELPAEIEPIFYTKSSVPLFQIVMPNIVNNYNFRNEMSNPMGLSIFANALDTLKEIDTSFDALNTEIETGRRMVFLSADLFFGTADGDIQNVISQKENVLRYIGAMNGSDGTLIKDFTPAMRTQDIQNTIQFQLNLLSEKVGMGTNRYEFTSKGMKTATEVVSENSDLFQSLRKHEIILQEALEEMIEAIAYLSTFTKENVTIKEIKIKFDDSIIEDKEAERKRYMEEVVAGAMSMIEYRMRVHNEDEETARKMLSLVEEVKADVMP